MVDLLEFLEESIAHGRRKDIKINVEEYNPEEIIDLLNELGFVRLEDWKEGDTESEMQRNKGINRYQVFKDGTGPVLWIAVSDAKIDSQLTIRFTDIRSGKRLKSTLYTIRPDGTLLATDVTKWSDIIDTIYRMAGK